MKVLYKQTENSLSGHNLTAFGISDCYIKKIAFGKTVTYSKKLHHHTGFELHMVLEGLQEYMIGESLVTLGKGQYLLVSPNTPHRAVSAREGTDKCAITFATSFSVKGNVFTGEITPRMAENIRFIYAEAERMNEFSSTVIGNACLEMLVTLLRPIGLKSGEKMKTEEENATIALAKQYINDNIERAPSVSEISDYCYLSEKQLTRLFERFEGVSPGEYIKGKRVKLIEELLSDGALSLKEISEKLNFNSEYYFSVYVKKHIGMPPGEYRKGIGK